MHPPGIPENEIDRLAKLQSLNILDTKPESRFDRYTSMTAHVFKTPISLISLVDRDRQWFKSAQGIEAKETPRDISFCGHAILGDDILEIENAQEDPLFHDNPLVTGEPNIRFYAGAPLKMPSGEKLGTLCIIDRAPRRLSTDDKRLLMNLADMVVGEMVHYVDMETGLGNRNALLFAGARCFDIPPERRRFSLLLFDIDGMLSAQEHTEPESSRTDQFSKLLHQYFPGALSIAHIGADHFCVLLRDDSEFDEILHVSHVCAEARKLLDADSQKNAISPLVGRIRYSREKYSSFDQVMQKADRMFHRREKQLRSQKMPRNRFFEALLRWRKTIY